MCFCYFHSLLLVAPQEEGFNHPRAAMATINVDASAAELFAQHKATLELLAAIGVQNSELQNTVREAVFGLETAGWASLNAENATAADGTFEAVAEYVRVLMPRDTLPGVCDWYHEQVRAHANAQRHFLGKVRIGDQIDVFADSNAERDNAEAAIKKNAGHKKAASQRDAEKARAKNKGGGGDKAQAKAKAAPAAAESAGEKLPFTLPDKTPIAHDAPKEARIQKVYDALQHLGIKYETVEHPPVPTVEDMMKHLGSQTGGKCKNLFLKSSKPLFYYLVVALHDTTFDTKGFSKSVGSKKPMRFAAVDVTGELLGGNKGDLSPFCLVGCVLANCELCA